MSRQQWIDTSAELPQHLEKLESALARLQGYMLPRIRSIDPVPALLTQVNAWENPTWVAP